MQAVPRREWMEFLDSLEIQGEVDLLSSRLEDHGGTRWKVRSADFDPFDHVIEIVLDNHEVSMRVLVDDPQTLRFEGEAQSPRRLLIGSNEGVLEITGRPAT